MPTLILTTSPIVLDSASYGIKNILSVPNDVWTYLQTLSPVPASAIVGTPAAWAAGSYAANSAVQYNGVWYVNNASATSGDVPGVAAKWVAVTYPAVSTGTVSSTATAGYVPDATGANKYKITAVPNMDGIITAVLDQTPTP